VTETHALQVREHLAQVFAERLALDLEETVEESLDEARMDADREAYRRYSREALQVTEQPHWSGGSTFTGPIAPLAATADRVTEHLLDRLAELDWSCHAEIHQLAGELAWWSREAGELNDRVVRQMRSQS